MAARSDRRQHAGEDLEAKVFLVAEPVRAALEDADLVVQPLADGPVSGFPRLVLMGCAVVQAHAA